MSDNVASVKRLYAAFNARDIDSALAEMSAGVMWANAMEGGHVRGGEAVREYWTRQWAVVSPHVEPVDFAPQDDGAVAVAVIQTVRDLEGRPLHDQDHGLKDKTVTHVFRFEDGRVCRFDVQDAA